MKKALQFLGTLVVALLVIAALVRSTPGQGTPFGNGRGAFRGDVYLPSSFNFWFGDVTSTDVSLQKNGANNVGISGHIGGQGSTANTTITPGANYAWGKVTFSAATTAVPVFAKPFVVAPVCFFTDETATGKTFQSTPTASQVTITASASTSDVVDYLCLGNPN